MRHALSLFRPLFSTRTLIRVAFTTLSLHSMGSAFGQGLAAGVTAPQYGSTWAAARALSHVRDVPVMASERPMDRQAEASAAPRGKIHVSAHRTGG